MAKLRAKSVLCYNLLNSIYSSKRHGNLILLPLLTLKYVGIKSMATGANTLVYNLNITAQLQRAFRFHHFILNMPEGTWSYLSFWCIPVEILNRWQFPSTANPPWFWFLTANWEYLCIHNSTVTTKQAIWWKQ